MNNANEPAYPAVESRETASGTVIDQYAGLTKREAFAMAAMQGMLAASQGWPDRTCYHEVASRSVSQADALLDELAKAQP